MLVRLTAWLRLAGVVLVVPVALLSVAKGAAAHSYGAPSTIFLGRAPPNCNGCHNGGTAPRVTVTSSAATLLPGQQIMLTVRVTTPNGRPGAAGFNLRADKPGMFAVGGAGGADTKIVTGTNGWSEATHARPKVGEPTTFTVSWSPADDVSGTITFVAWGNAADADGRDGPKGDRASRATTKVTVIATQAAKKSSALPAPSHKDVVGGATDR